MTGPPLRTLTSCEACGACCRVVTRPPFLRRTDGTGEEAWETLRRDHPERLADLNAADAARRASGLPDYGTPCLWYDPVEARCLYYDLRPNACRAFALNSTDCHDARRRAGVES